MGYIIMWGKQYVRRKEKNKVSSTNSGWWRNSGRSDKLAC